MALAIESVENDEPVSEHHMMALLLQGLGPEFEEKVLSKYGKESGFRFPPCIGLLAEAKEEKRQRTGKKFKPGD